MPTPARPDADARSRKRRRGRPKAHWATRSRGQRKRCHKRLRRCQVDELFAADRFASCRPELRLITFVTIWWRGTAEAEDNIASRMTKLLNAARTWARSRGLELAHIYVHENPETGFNTHILMNLPSGLRSAFTTWLVKHLRASSRAVDVRPRTCHRAGRTHEDRLRYMVKGTDWGTAVRYRIISPRIASGSDAVMRRLWPC
jgi:hypothetical protein